jgi:Zn-dependent M28 family amino/carboxypeptidase
MNVAFAPYVHANCPNSPTRNVVAWLPGKKHPERMIVIGGHLDSRTFNVLDVAADTSAQLADAGAPNAHVLANAPAGNDAAAQTNVVLEAAAALARANFDDTLVFISFSGEEQGLFGSADIATNAGARSPLRAAWNRSRGLRALRSSPC